MRGGKAVKALPTLTRQGKAYVRLTILVSAGLRITQVFSPNGGNAGHEIPGFFTGSSIGSVPWQQDSTSTWSSRSSPARSSGS